MRTNGLSYCHVRSADGHNVAVPFKHFHAVAKWMHGDCSTWTAKVLLNIPGAFLLK